MHTIEPNKFDALLKTTKRHAAALFFGEIPDLIWKGSGRYIQAQGTITFIRYRNRCFGVTNDHVYHAPSSKTVVWHMALNTHQPFLQQPLFASTQNNPDFPFDIALFELDEGVILRGGKMPVDVNQDALLTEGDPLLAVGFPKRRRKLLDEQGYVAHGLYHVVATAIGISDRNIELHESLLDPKQKRWHFGGMSGGPIFQVTSETSYRLAGIIHQAPKTPTPNTIYIRGFPFGKTQLEWAFRRYELDKRNL